MSASLKIMTFVFMLTFLAACNGVSVQDTGTAAAGAGGTGNGSGDSSIVFAGITSYTNISDVSLTVNWTSNTDAAVYEIYDVTSGTPSLKLSVMAPASSVHLPNLLSNTPYKFRARMRTSAGLNDTNTNDVAVSTGSLPSAPSALTLVTPATSPNSSPIPKINIAGVVTGNEVKLFTTSNCAPSSQVAVGTAAGTSLDLTSSPLIPGVHTFYATRKNGSSVSACSTATLSYTINGCPTGYLYVASNPDVGVNSFFCVMKFEARQATTSLAEASSTGLPWVGIDAHAAITACHNLNNVSESKYAMISNAEWMAVARSIEAQSSNYNTLAINKGFSDGGGGVIAIADLTNPWTGTGQTSVSQWNQKRTHRLANSVEEIWDFSGNAWEWVDWAVESPTNTFTLSPSCPSSGWSEFQDLTTACNNITYDEMSPLDHSYNSTQNMGKFILGTGRGLTRGGTFVNYGINFNGIYAYHSGNQPGSPATDIGFRCVYRP